jgi:hypothetical protein
MPAPLPSQGMRALWDLTGAPKVKLPLFHLSRKHCPVLMGRVRMDFVVFVVFVVFVDFVLFCLVVFSVLLLKLFVIVSTRFSLSRISQARIS